MSLLELIASLLGVIAVWLTVRQNSWCWPIGLGMVSLYAWFFFDAKLLPGLLVDGRALRAVHRAGGAGAA